MKKRLGRPPGRKAARRPVLSTRVPEDFFQFIKQVAQSSGRTMSGELIWRARNSFEREKAPAMTKLLQLTMLDGDAVYVFPASIQYIVAARPGIDAPGANARLQLSGVSLSVQETPDEIETLMGWKIFDGEDGVQ